MTFSEIKRHFKQSRYNYKLPLYTYHEAALYFLDMIKNVADTFTPYKTSKHLQRDLLQFFYGAKNISIGLFLIPVAIFSPLVPHDFVGWDCKDEQKIIRNLVGALAQTLSGIIQIVISPLALVRALWRSCLSPDTKWQKFQDRKSIKNLVSKADSIIENNDNKSISSMRPILDALHRKALSNEKKQQECYPNKKNIPLYGESSEDSYDGPTRKNSCFFFPYNSNVYPYNSNGMIQPDELLQAIKQHLNYFRPN